MRLLEIKGDGFTFTDFDDPDAIPPYAILSHTWETDEEVTFDELRESTRKRIRKSGYNKLHFCGQQAKRDGMRYFWVDTCCTIQAHHRRQRPTKRVAYAAKNGGRMYIAFQYKRINISILMQPESGPPSCSG
ncbi:hypothetical protein K458DRAFT_365183 [Lentithecium fluviatile CBS 122367]|uniref:Heterokaryon incompatibility domain-containing protein n=1 Tax=Lentithecium fluviatile CBS 122367 TaxID=1168545 RepID=A0A6G1J3D8_9PLEO|nr:hypothetical protein K458DRAFT_365183 [Lentithecium fluviatile CBS 122367]